MAGGGCDAFFKKNFQALDALSNECASRVKIITQSLTANEALAPLKRQVEKDAKTLAVFFNVENASADIEQSVDIQLLTEKGLLSFVWSILSPTPLFWHVLIRKLIFGSKKIWTPWTPLPRHR